MSLTVAKVHYEKALNMTGFSRYNVYVFILCCCSIMAATFEVYSLDYLAPASGCEFQTSAANQTLMVSLPLMGLLGTSHLWGYLGDTKGRRKCLLIGTTGGFISSVLAAFSPHWIVLSIFKFLSSAFLGCGYPMSQILMAESTPIAKRNILVIATTSVFLASFGTISVLAMPILPLTFSLHIPVLSIEFNSWRLFCLVLAIPSGISALLAWKAVESPKHLLAEGKEDEARQALRRIYEINSGKSGDSYKVGALAIREDVLETVPSNFLKGVIARTTPITKPPFSKYAYRIAGLLIVCYACFMFFVMWLLIVVNAVNMSASSNNNLTVCDMVRTYNNRTLEVIPTNCAMNSTVLSVMFGVSMTLAALNLLITGLVKFVARKYIIIAIQIVSGLALLLVNASSYWILGGILTVVYLFGVLIHGILTSYIIEIFPTYVKAVATCLLIMVGSSQVSLMITLIEKFLVNHCEVVFYLYGAVACLGVLLGVIMPDDVTIQQMKREIKEETEDEAEDSGEDARL